MNILRKIQISLFLLFASASIGFGQMCMDFHRTNDCRTDLVPFFKYYNQSRSDLIKVGYTVKYSLVFYGDKEYMVSFCTHKNFYPVNFKLVDETSGQVLYDNKEDEYVESIGFAVEKTKLLQVEVEILAHRASDKEIEEDYPCIGMLIQVKDLEAGDQ